MNSKKNFILKLISWLSFLSFFIVLFHAIGQKNDPNLKNTTYIVADFDLFDEHPKIGNVQISCSRLKKYLNAKEFSVKQVKSVRYLSNPQAIIIFNYGANILDLQKYPKEQRILFLWEPPTVFEKGYNKSYHQYFSKIFTWDDTLVDNKTYFKLFYPQPTMAMREPILDFDQKKLCTNISCHKKSSYPFELYTERKKIIEFFEFQHPTDFDLYGIGWHSSQFKTYQGTIDDKIATLQKYKFSICYENTRNSKGYITEKIFDCFIAGCVPIYWGAENITDYIPKTCFIDRRDFGSLEQLYAYMSSITREQYQSYINNIQAFLKSQKAQLFSSDHFIKTFFDAISSTHASTDYPKYAAAQNIPGHVVPAT